MADVSSNISIITLDVNGLNTPIKRQRLASDFKNMTHLCFVYKKFTSNITISVGWKWNMEKEVSYKH